MRLLGSARGSLIMAAGVLAAGLAFAEPEKEGPADETDQLKFHTVTTKEGLTFWVPEDMPIENRNGIQAPIPFEEYIAGKAQALDKRLKAVESRLDEAEKKLGKDDAAPAAKNAPGEAKPLQS